MKANYRVRWKRDNRWRYRNVVKLSTAERYQRWINSEQSLHWYCENSDYGYHDACLSKVQIPAVIQKRLVGEWETLEEV